MNYTLKGIKLKKVMYLYPIWYKIFVMEHLALPKYVKLMRKQYRLTQIDLSENRGLGFVLYARPVGRIVG